MGPGLKVYVVLDICHMLKLARNALGDMKCFVTPTGDKISWEYIKALYDIQQQDILHIGNKLKTKHIQWQKHKMNVSVAAQTLSASVASAICNFAIRSRFSLDVFDHTLLPYIIMDLTVAL